MLAYGKIESQILQYHMETRTPPPQWAQEAPELLEGLEFYLTAFFELTGDRPVAFSVAPIPMKSIRDYAKEENLSEEETEDFTFFIRAMDDEFLAYSSEQATAGKESGTPARRNTL